MSTHNEILLHQFCVGSEAYKSQCKFDKQNLTGANCTPTQDSLNTIQEKLIISISDFFWATTNWSAFAGAVTMSRETQSSRVLPRIHTPNPVREAPQRSQHFKGTISGTAYSSNDRTTNFILQPLALSCEYELCGTTKEAPHCYHYCSEHCCDHIPDHFGEMAKRFARDEPKKFNSRRCCHSGCTAMRVRTCTMYCRNHCCHGEHDRWRETLNKKVKQISRLPRRKDRHDDH